MKRRNELAGILIMIAMMTTLLAILSFFGFSKEPAMFGILI